MNLHNENIMNPMEQMRLAAEFIFKHNFVDVYDIAETMAFEEFASRRANGEKIGFRDEFIDARAAEIVLTLRKFAHQNEGKLPIHNTPVCSNLPDYVS